MTIGVTGHRVLMDIDRLEASLGHVVTAIDDSFPAEEWTVVSALAEGADRLVARRLLAHPGARLLAVLPLPRADYTTDFPSQASRDEFQALLDSAGEVVELPPGGTRDEAYESAGRFVLDRADIVVAVWDGQVAQGRGGVGGVVAAARERGLPLAWVHAGNRRPGTREPTSLGADQGRVILERFPEPSPGMVAP